MKADAVGLPGQNQDRDKFMGKIKEISRGQVNIEITFSMIIIVMLLLSMIRVFFWVGNDLADRRRAHEDTLTGDEPADYAPSLDKNYKQIRPVFYEGTPIDAATVSSEIFGINRLK